MPENNKIVILGPVKSGKSALVEKIVNNIFNTNYIPTVGMSFGIRSCINDLGRSTQLHLWSTSGDSNFRCMLPAYIKNSVIVVIVINDIHTVDEIMEWVDLAERFTPESKIYIVVSKIDVSNKHIENLIPYIMDYNFELHYVSSKTGEGIKELLFSMENYITHLEEKPTPLEDTYKEESDYCTKINKCCICKII